MRAGAGAAGSASFRTNACEREKPILSSRRVRPGCDGKTPLERGIVTGWSGTRSGSRSWNALAPTDLRPRAFSSSLPSPLGTVRASSVAMPALSRMVQSVSGTPSSLNSFGRALGFSRTCWIQAFTPAVYASSRARISDGSFAMFASSSGSAWKSRRETMSSSSMLGPKISASRPLAWRLNSSSSVSRSWATA